MNNFDQVIPRLGTDSFKWNHYPADVLPMWVADMDFQAPPAVIEALHRRIDQGVFGYVKDSKALTEVICQRMLRLYNWHIEAQDIVPLPGVISGFNIACRAVGEAGDGVLIQPPVYPPFLTAPGNQQRRLQIAPLSSHFDGEFLRYGVDLDAFARQMTAQTRLFMLCHPHNPIGRSFSEEELKQMADICLQRKLVICADEIHADLILEGEHRPFASLDPEIARHTISLFAPSKTYNIAGFGFSYAIIQNPQLRTAYKRAMAGIVAEPNLASIVSALAAYQHGDAWLQEVLAYLRANRDFALAYLAEHMPQLKVTRPEASFLLWIDGREIADNAYAFFLQQAKVAFNDGRLFGDGGEGFVRLNFGCPRQTLTDGLQRMRQALAR